MKHFGMETALREASKVENYSRNSHQISFHENTPNYTFTYKIFVVFIPRNGSFRKHRHIKNSFEMEKEKNDPSFVE
jgi:hypothetical protein